MEGLLPLFVAKFNILLCPGFKPHALTGGRVYA